MLIAVGKKLKKERLGWTGGFCPICRRLERMRLTRLRRVKHVYYVSLGRGEAVVDELRCRSCGTVFGSEIVEYEGHSPLALDDVVELIEITNPDAAAGVSARLELEDRLASGALTAEERRTLIAEPLISLNYMTSKKTGKGMIPSSAGFCIVGLVFLGPAMVITWLTAGTPLEVRMLLAGVVCVLVLGTIAGFRYGGRGWVRRHVNPRLARALAPLHPSAEELDAVLAELSPGHVIRKRVNGAEVAALTGRVNEHR